MKLHLLAGCISLGLLVPASFAADKSADPSNKVERAAGAVKENLGDAAITAKIKTEFAKDKQVSALKINVDTDNKGAVTLKGTAKSKEEAAKAESIAKAVSGVTSVKNEIRVAGSTN